MKFFECRVGDWLIHDSTFCLKINENSIIYFIYSSPHYLFAHHDLNPNDEVQFYTGQLDCGKINEKRQNKEACAIFYLNKDICLRYYDSCYILCNRTNMGVPKHIKFIGEIADKLLCNEVISYPELDKL